MTAELIQILQHALGLDQYGQGKGSRNHFCAGGTDVPLCRELVAMGYMETFERSYLPHYNCQVTDAGRAAVKEHSPVAPTLTRSQKRYRQYLDADTGVSFREWLDLERTRAAR